MGADGSCRSRDGVPEAASLGVRPDIPKALRAPRDPHTRVGGQWVSEPAEVFVVSWAESVPAGVWGTAWEAAPIPEAAPCAHGAMGVEGWTPWSAPSSALDIAGKGSTAPGGSGTAV